ncbi:MAG: divalent-cation tolerance protein CutA [Myxococcales bacterium]|jgi:periplasmic divalent cation tolerance protein
MSSRPKLWVVLCTVPNDIVAEQIGRGLVEHGLAACVNAVPGLRSFYRWQGKIQDDSEVQLLIKTCPERFDELAAWLDAHHPYEVPEIVALPAEQVNDGYLSWAIEQTSGVEG